MEKQQLNQLKQFINKNVQHLTQKIKSTPIQQIKSKIIKPSQLDQAANQIKNGNLVAFPTQTVYGLGANALDQKALAKIYQTKRRPLTDPIIVHVLNVKQAKQLTILNQKQQQIFQLLTSKFWPGPLTIILKANLTILPNIVTAQTGFVGVRSPNHPYARKLIQISQLPIGAPSANLFSHVSPTQAVHVFNDFFDQDVNIVDGKRCQYGIQSTVIKLIDQKNIHVLREGSLSVSILQQHLKNNLNVNQLPAVTVYQRIINHQVKMQSPGQLLKHYAPYLPCFVYDGNQKIQKLIDKDQNKQYKLQNIAFISFNKIYQQTKSKFKYYFQVGNCIKQQQQNNQQLFCTKQQKERMRQIYHLLRRCQNLQVDCIVIGWHEDKSGTIWDKILRSTQGKYLNSS